MHVVSPWRYYSHVGHVKDGAAVPNQFYVVDRSLLILAHVLKLRRNGRFS